VHIGCNVISFYVKMSEKKHQVFGIPPEMRLDALFHFMTVAGVIWYFQKIFTITGILILENVWDQWVHCLRQLEIDHVLISLTRKNFIFLK
ncbi:hypothetical protein HN51_061847, partial [Arachis hypogaea]